MNARGVIAIVSCVVGLGLVFFGSVMGTKSPNQEASASGNPGANPQNKKPVRAWNMALGNVVVVDQELGFSVKAGKESHPQQGKLLTRIESRLQNLRELYREEGEKQPALMGGMTLQFSVNSAGEVTLVKEVSSRISDTEFKKAVIAEVSQWSFQDVVTDSVTVTCPLLFVREGMDITTLVQWEKTLGHFGEKTAVAKGKPQPIQQVKAPEAPKQTANEAKVAAAPAEAPKQTATQAKVVVTPLEKEAVTPAVTQSVKASEKPAASAAVKSTPAIYKIKYPTSIRKEPDFKSAAVARFTKGTKVTVVTKNGDWWEVRYYQNGPSGFLRKEFVAPLELAQQ